jgi:hypothetical protein
MKIHRPINLGEYSSRWVYPNGECVAFEVEVEAENDNQAIRVAQNLEGIHDQALKLLSSFMKETGTFELEYVYAFAQQTAEQGDFFLSFGFTADRDAHEYGYTYFHVHFFEHQKPSPHFWPFKFVVGFN